MCFYSFTEKVNISLYSESQLYRSLLRKIVFSDTFFSFFCTVNLLCLKAEEEANDYLRISVFTITTCVVECQYSVILLFG